MEEKTHFNFHGLNYVVSSGLTLHNLSYRWRHNLRDAWSIGKENGVGHVVMCLE